jgi:hypothetical protein
MILFALTDNSSLLLAFLTLQIIFYYFIKLQQLGMLHPISQISCIFSCDACDHWCSKDIDEQDERLFPSLKAIGRVKKQLDEKAKLLIGYECKVMKYGEVYFINFNNALRLL